MRPVLALVAAHAFAAALLDPPLAWTWFDQHPANRYADRHYHFLGDGPLHLAIDVAPDRARALDLLWGSKSDERGAVVTVNGQRTELRAGGYDGYRWQRIALAADSAATCYEVHLAAGPPRAAFLAALRLVDPALPPATDLVAPGTGKVRLLPPPPDQLERWAAALRADGLDAFARAELHGHQANAAFVRCRRYLHGWLAHADPETGLIPQNLQSPIWNGRNAAADNYAFLVLTASFVEPALYAGRLREMLATERRLTTAADGLPRPYDLARHALATERAGPADAIFDASEYVKDGLLPITEWLGATPWSARMIELVDAILANARVATPAGPIPADDAEVGGELMQVLSRLCCRGERPDFDRACLDMACRIADHWLLGDRHPTRGAAKLRLRDHGCELISGLTEVYAACRALRPEQAARYRAPLHAMLDDILAIGVNEHGLFYQVIDPRGGKVLDPTIHDNFGYDLNGFLTVWQLDGIERYRAATIQALASLKPHYWAHAWEGQSADGIADAVEGALNLWNREPVAGVAEWADANMGRMFAIQRPDGVVEGWHGDGNFARTALLWALMKQQGVTLRPWREDVRLGAVRDGDALVLVAAAERDWTGALVFDTPRHRTHLHLPRDYPRINQFPEWFTVAAEASYRIAAAGTSAQPPVTGSSLAAGWSVALRGGEPVRFTVRPLR
jgi:hypothetical protein